MAATFEQIDKTPPVDTQNDGEGFNPADYQEGAPNIQNKTDAEGNKIVTASGGPGLCTDLNDCPLEIPPLPELQGSHGFGPKPPQSESTFSPTTRPKEVGFGPKYTGPVFSPTERIETQPIGIGPKYTGPKFYPTSGSR